MKKIIFLIVVFLFIAGCTSEKTVIFRMQNGDYKIKAEVADTDESRARGLMFREKLAADSGMLFVFKEEAVRSFWMKNTLIPLDIIFVSADGKITNIAENAMPCKSDPCESHKSAGLAMYVVEIAGGESTKRGILPGDSVEF